MTKWVTLSEASVILGMSERTIHRYVSCGKIESIIENGRRLVNTDSLSGMSDKSDDVGMTVSDKDAFVDLLRKELDTKNQLIERMRIEMQEKDNVIQKLQEELKNSRERADIIVMKLADELEAQRAIFEGKQPKNKGNDSFWRRISKKDDNN